MRVYCAGLLAIELDPQFQTVEVCGNSGMTGLHRLGGLDESVVPARIRTGQGQKRMRTILVLAPHPELADAMRTGLNPEQYRVVHRGSPEEAEPLLAHGLADVCVLDLDLTGVQGIWVVEKLQRRALHCPLIVYAGARSADWEEEAYLKGVKHVLAKPFRSRLLMTVLDGLFAQPAAAAPAVPAVSTRQFDTAFFGASAAPSSTPVPHFNAPSSTGPSFQNLHILRDFSAILTHSLDADALLRQFLLLIREITGVNRSAIFLRPANVPFMTDGVPVEARQLGAACAIGLASNLLENVRLSFDAGIGGHVGRTGRILRRHSPEAADVETQREFELLGAQVAIPLLDRERLLGVAVLDARVTGEPLANAELELIFHLLEQVGLAVKNIWLHDQVAGNHAMLADVMRELSSACVVVSRDLAVLHANRMARKYFGQTGSRSGELEFTDIPTALGSKIFQVLKTGSALAPFRYTPEEEPGTVYQVTISPVHHTDAALPASALLIVEDRTQAVQLQRLEQEAGQLKADKEKLEQRREISVRLAMEIGNALTEPVIYMGIYDDQIKDTKFRLDLKHAMDRGIARITRRKDQLTHTAREGAIAAGEKTIKLHDLILAAYEDAMPHLTKEEFSRKAKPVLDKPAQSFTLNGDAAALRFAFMEVMLNGLQAGGPKPELRVEMNPSGDSCVEVSIADNGPGFTPESAKQAGTPFWMGKEKIVGLGLGLYVARKIVEAHGGKLEIPAPAADRPGMVKIVLPVTAGPVGEGRINVPMNLSSAKH